MGWNKVEDSLPGVGRTDLDKEGMKATGVLAVRKVSPNYAEVISLTYFMKNPYEFTRWAYIPPFPDAEEKPLAQKELRGIRELLKRACL